MGRQNCRTNREWHGEANDGRLEQARTTVREALRALLSPPLDLLVRDHFAHTAPSRGLFARTRAGTRLVDIAAEPHNDRKETARIRALRHRIRMRQTRSWAAAAVEKGF